MCWSEIVSKSSPDGIEGGGDNLAAAIAQAGKRAEEVFAAYRNNLDELDTIGRSILAQIELSGGDTSHASELIDSLFEDLCAKFFETTKQAAHFHSLGCHPLLWPLEKLCRDIDQLSQIQTEENNTHD